MAGRDPLARGPVHVYTVQEAIRDELAREPLTLRQVAGFLAGLVVVLLLVVLFLATGPVSA